MKFKRWVSEDVPIFWKHVPVKFLLPWNCDASGFIASRKNLGQKSAV